MPIIFLSAARDPKDKVKGLDLGAVDYVTKPFDAFELRARVRAALRTKHLQDLLAHYAMIDSLTELPNRRALMERLVQEWARIRRHGGSLSVIMSDIDKFKEINDVRGHQIGDLALQVVADAIKGECRETDIPTRYGGDEFAVLVVMSSENEAAALAERCRQRVENLQIGSDGERVTLTSSFGVAGSDGREHYTDIIKEADEALYRAKSLGRNRVELAGQEMQFANIHEADDQARM